MTALDAARAELGLVVLYLNKAEARDKICRAIQYGSKFISNGQPGTAKTVDSTTTLARKVFRLFKVFIYLSYFFNMDSIWYQSQLILWKEDIIDYVLFHLLLTNQSKKKYNSKSFYYTKVIAKHASWHFFNCTSLVPVLPSPSDLLLFHIMLKCGTKKTLMQYICWIFVLSND